MSRRKIEIKLPVTNNRKGDLSRPWYVEYSVRNPKNGVLERFRIYEGLSAGSEAERTVLAAKIATQIRRKLKTGWTPFDKFDVIYSDSLTYQKATDKLKKAKSNNNTWRLNLSVWLDQHQHAIRKSTYQSYQAKFRIFVEFLELKKMDSDDILYFDSKAIDSFYLFLQNTRKLCNKTVNEYTILLRRVSKDLLKKNIITENHFIEVKRLRSFSKKPIPFNDVNIQNLKKMILAIDPQLWLCIQFIFYSFIRPNELRLLQMKHLDLVAGKIIVPGEFSKNHKTQTVIIPDPLLDYLKELNFESYSYDDYLITLKGTPGPVHVGRNYMGNHFRRVRFLLKMPSAYKFYGWKHTGVLRLKRSGADPFAMKDQLRHYSFDEMLEYIIELEGAESSHIKHNGPRI